MVGNINHRRRIHFRNHRGILDIINNTATERFVFKMNDVPFRDELMYFRYQYDGLRTIHFTGDKSSFTYNVSVNGNTMRLGNEEDEYFNLTKQ